MSGESPDEGRSAWAEKRPKRSEGKNGEPLADNLAEIDSCRPDRSLADVLDYLLADADKALDRMWAAQRPDGGWDWPFRDVPPIKDTEHYGATFAALGAGLAPGGYAMTEAARKGLGGVRKYLKGHPPTTLHERAMLLWLAQSVEGVLTENERALTLKDLLAAQRPDGGWSMASLVENPKDPKRQTDQGKKARGEGPRRRIRSLRRPR